MQQLRGKPMLLVVWGAIFFAWVCQAQLITTQTFDFNSLAGVGPGPFPVPPNYGAIPNVQIRYMPNAGVYDFNKMALSHTPFYLQNDTITISTTALYVLSLDSYNGMAYGSRQSLDWHWVTCGDTIQQQSLNPWSSVPRTVVPKGCSGQSVSLNFGTSWDLGIIQISYSLYGVNSCQVNNGGCGPNGVCNYVSPAQVTCSCNQGYMDVGGTCGDINECSQSNYGGCTHPPAGMCVNFDGGYNCVCQDGFRPTPANPQLNATCVDINECETFPPVCGSPSQGTCYDFGNTTSGYNCTCNFGFSGPITGPCISDTTCGGCGPFSVCNQITHLCDCLAGYQPVGGPHAGCGDINECLIGSMGCDPGMCDNTPGGWSCKCPPGFNLVPINASAAICSDINECANYACGLALSTTTCTNLPGTYNCTCKDGSARANATAPCVVIDFCLGGTHCGNGTCTNTPNTAPFWSCACNSGYDPDPNNSDHCLDINECALNPGPCPNDPNACVNTIGGFSCGAAAAEVPGSTSSLPKTIGIGFGYGLAALLGCILLIFLILCLRKRYSRHQYIQRRLKRAALEGVELTMRNHNNEQNKEETNEDILNAPLEGNFMNDDIMHGDTADEPHNGGGGGGRQGRGQDQDQDQDRDEMDTAHLRGLHQHSSSSEAVIPPASGGTNEGPSQFQGVPTPADAEFGEDAIGPDGEYVLVVTPRNGAGGVMRTQSSILLQPKIRIIDDRSQEFKRAPIAAALSAASVLAVSASGALNTKSLPRITPQAAQQQPQPQPKLAPQIQPHHQQQAARAATPPPREPTPPPAQTEEEERPPSPLIPNELDWPEDTDGPIPVRPRKPLPELPLNKGDVVNAIEGMPANADEEEAALNAAMAESLMVPEGGSGPHSSGGPHSGEHSAQSTGKYSQQPSQQNSGQFQLQQEGLSPDEPHSPVDNDQTDLAEEHDIDYASDLDDQPVNMSEKAKKEAQKRKKHEFEAHLKHEKEEEARRRKQAKADEAKHKKEGKSHKVQDEIHVDPEKEAAIRNAFARFRQQDAAAKAVEEAALPVSDDLMIAPSSTSGADEEHLPLPSSQQQQQQDSEHSSPSTGPSEGMSRLQNIEPVDVLAGSADTQQQRSGSFHPAPAHPVDVAPAHVHKPVAARPAAMLEDSPKSARSDQHGVLYNQSPSEFDHRLLSRMEGEPRSAGVQHSEPASPSAAHAVHQPPAAVSAHSASAAAVSAVSAHPVASHAQHNANSHSFDFSNQQQQQQPPQQPPQLQQQQSYSARLPQSVVAAALNVKGPSHPAVPVADLSRQSVSSVSPGAGSVSRVGKESAHNTLNIRAAPGGPGGKKYSHSSSASDVMPPAVALALHRGSSHSKNGELPTPSGPPTLKRVPSEGVPSQRRSESTIVRSITLRDVLSGRNPRCLRAFSDFCKAERIADNLEFYKIIEEYRHQKAEAEQKSLNEEPELVAQDMAEKADEIFKLFLNPQKPKVNLPEDVGSRLASRSFKYHRTGQMDAVLLPADDGVGFAVAAFVPTVFDEAQEVAFKQMETDAWFRFMKTDRAREFDS